MAEMTADEIEEWVDRALTRGLGEKDALLRTQHGADRLYAEGLADGMAEACRQVLAFIRGEQQPESTNVK